MSDTMPDGDQAQIDLPETDKQRAARELAEAREKHALAYLSAQDVSGDPEEATLLRDNLHAATQGGKRAYRSYVRAALDPLAAQIDGPELQGVQEEDR